MADQQIRRTSASPDRRAQLTVLYDADCGVCRHTARTLRTLDTGGRLRFTPLQGFVAASAADPDRQALLARLHVRAARRIAEVIPALLPLGLVARLPGAGRVTDAAYDLVARNRQSLSRWLRLDACRFDPGPPDG